MHAARRRRDRGPATPPPTTDELRPFGASYSSRTLKKGGRVVAASDVPAATPRRWSVRVTGCGAADIDLVDALARLQLTVRRLGGSTRVVDAPDDLRRLLDVTGLLGLAGRDDIAPVDPR
jgi:hypothetical protein